MHQHKYLSRNPHARKERGVPVDLLDVSGLDAISKHVYRTRGPNGRLHTSDVANVLSFSSRSNSRQAAALESDDLLFREP